MKALSVEQSILDGEKELQELFKYVETDAQKLEAYDMEKVIFSRIMQIGLAVMKCCFAEKGTGDIGAESPLDNGAILEKVSTLRGRDYFSVFGEIKVPRTYYHSVGLSGVMPLDASADLPERSYSYLLQEWMDTQSIRDSFKESVITQAELSGLKVSSSRLEVVNRDTGKHYDKFYEEKELPASEKEGVIQAVQSDGKGVPVIKKEAAKLKARQGKGEKRQKKKEAMAGVSYTVNKNKRTPEVVADNLIYPEKTKADKKTDVIVLRPPEAWNIRRTASLERSKKEVVEKIMDDAESGNPDDLRPWVVVMDRASGLWNSVAEMFSGTYYVGIPDIIHVVEYLWAAGNALYGENNPETDKQVYKKQLSILLGNVGRVIGGLKQTLKKRKPSKSKRDAIKWVIRYSENHRQWMHYDEYLKAGFPIGGGVVESTCGHTVKDRMEGTGRRQSIEGVESTLPLRSVYTGGDWDAYWEWHMKSERSRLYGGVLKASGTADDYYNDILTDKAA
ncbi:ISKra4 family transposase [Desulfococcaceae bacterium HSG9]|nr:ISKra4 family transposase [Desulfococcaceae bacterium HSG9]